MTAVSCRILRRHLDALVDGELDTSVQVEFDAHIAGCVICREHAAFSHSVKRAVRQELGDVRAPDGLRMRVVTALQSAPEPAASGPERPFLRVRMLPARYAVPAAAAVVLVVAWAAQRDPEAEHSAVASTVPLFEDVVRRHSSEHPAEVAGPPQHVVGWFRGRLEFPVRPVEFEQQDAHFIGARLSNVRDREAAAFYYEVHGHRVTVLVFEPPPSDLQARPGTHRVVVQGRELLYGQVRGFTVPVVEQDGLAYAFTGDLDSQSMIRLAASARMSH